MPLDFSETCPPYLRYCVWRLEGLASMFSGVLHLGVGGGRAGGNSPLDLVEVIPLAAPCGFLASCSTAFCGIFLASGCCVGILAHMVGRGEA